jgi:putative addiction module component (TIGR02574 family)
MTKDQVKEILDRVLTWPPERQADVVHVVEMMEKQHGELRLTDEQAAEVRRRLAEPSPNRVPAEEVFKRLRSRIA